MKTIKAILLVTALSIFLFSCFSDFIPGEGSIVRSYARIKLNLGNTSARSGFNPGVYHITIKDSAGIYKVIENYTSGEIIEVPRGLLTIEARTFGDGTVYNNYITGLLEGLDIEDTDEHFPDNKIQISFGTVDVTIRGGGLTDEAPIIYMGEGIQEANNWSQLLAIAHFLNEGGTLEIRLKGGNYNAYTPCVIDNGKNITLIADGDVVIMRTEDDFKYYDDGYIYSTYLYNVFYIDNGNLTLGSTDMKDTLTIDGTFEEMKNYTAHALNAIIYIIDGTLEMNNNVILENGDSFAVYMNGGNFTMSGGIIKKNTSGVYVNDGNFTMSGGTISDNGREGLNIGGGGVSLSGESVFEMSGSATISNNIANNGGGVYVYRESTIIMSGNATISNNTAEEVDIGYVDKGGRGGGVYLSPGESGMSGGILTMDGNANISENIAIDGGGVYVSGGGNQWWVVSNWHDTPSATLIMNGGTISGNTAQNGGGVFLERGFERNIRPIIGNNGPIEGGNFYMYAGTASGNTAVFGREVYIQETLDDGMEGFFSGSFTDGVEYGD